MARRDNCQGRVDPMNKYRIVRSFLISSAAALLLAGCGGSAPLMRQESSPSVSLEAGPEQLGQALPQLAGLPQGEGLGLRTTANTSSSLLDRAPVMQSGGNSAVWSAGSLSLTPAAAGEMAWAIFEVFEFPLDGSIVPSSFTSSPQSGFYIGFADYDGERWKLRRA